MNQDTHKPAAVALLEQTASDVPELTPDQLAHQQLLAEAGGDPQALQALGEASADVPELTEDQVALESLKKEIDDERHATLTRTLGTNPLMKVQTRDGNIVNAGEADPSEPSGPYNNGRRA